MELASFQLGEDLVEKTALDLFGEQIIRIDDGKKWFMPKFIIFQYGELNTESRVHKSVIGLLQKYLINPDTLTIPLTNPSRRIKDKDKDKDKDIKGGMGGKEKRQTWLTAYSEIWTEILGGEMPCEKFARDLKKAEKAVGREEAIKRWRIFLQRKPEYANAAYFQQKIKCWGESANGNQRQEDKYANGF
jgi:hypothetical protein